MPRAGYEEVVLLTGFPALQARKLLGHILDVEPGTFVYLVVLKRLLARAEQALAMLTPQARSRVGVLEGDAAAIDLGLSGAELRALAPEIDRIHHVAHVNYLGVEPSLAELANVRAAAEAVEVARLCPALRCLVHHSTAAVCGDRTGIVREDELDLGQGFFSVIHQTRMRGEKVMRRAMSSLPITVVRPTTVVGDSGTGESDHFDGPYLLVMLILGLPGDMAVPMPSPGDTPVNIVPVDFVVRAAHVIAHHPSAAGRTFHLASPERLTAAELFTLVAQSGGRRTAKSTVPTQLARVLLRTPGVERLLHRPRELLQQFGSPVRFDTTNADGVLGPAGVACPPLSSYVDTLVSAVQDHLRQRRREFRLAIEHDGPDDPLL